MTLPNKKRLFSILWKIIFLLSIASSTYSLIIIQGMHIFRFLLLTGAIFIVAAFFYYSTRHSSEGVKLLSKLAIAVIFGSGAIFASIVEDARSANSYTDSTENFHQVTVLGINTLKQDHDMWIYIGRESCPNCYEFAPKLAEAVEDSGTRIYYLDTDSEDEQLHEFAEEYHINSVPNFIYLEDGELAAQLNIRNDTTSEDIRNFISDVDAS